LPWQRVLIALEFCLALFNSPTSKTPCSTQRSRGYLVYRPRHNHVFQIWWRSVRGFSDGWGSNFAIPHWLWRSSSQHSHTTVWACDNKNI